MIFKSRNLRNSYWNILDTIVYPIAFLAATPIFINELGESVFGVWMLINSIMVTAQALNFGVGNSLIHKVAKYLGHKEYGVLRRLVSSGIWLSVFLGLFVLLLGFGIGFFLDAGQWIPEKGDIQESISLAIVVAGGVLALRVVDQAFISVYKGFEKYERATWFSLGFKMGALAINLWVVFQGGGLYELFMSRLVIAGAVLLIQFLSMFFFLRREIGTGLYLKPGRYELEELLGYGLWAWLQTMASIMLFQLDKILVTAFFGTSVLAYYSLASMIQSHMHISLGAIVHWLFPRVSRRQAEGKPILPLFLGMRALVVSFGITSILVLFMLRKPIFSLWLGEEKSISMMPFLESFIALELLVVLIIVPFFFFNGIGKARQVALFEGAHKSFGMLGMLTAYYLLRTPESLVWGMAAGIFISLPYLFYWLQKNAFNRTFLKEGALVFIPSLLAIVFMLVDGVLIDGALLLLILVSVYLIFWNSERFNWKDLIN